MPLTVMALLYGVGTIRVAGRRRGRGSLPGPAIAFWAAMVALCTALVSPLHWLGEHVFAFHMIEHEMVMAVAAPLLVVARPVGTLMWGLPRWARRRLGSLMHTALVQKWWQWCAGATNATVIHGLAIWIWHIPFLFDAAVTDTAVHRLQHLSFFATALLFWWALLWRTERGASAWHFFSTMIHTSVLGALMALAPRVLYVAQTRAMEWGVTPLEDQQLAGLIMWVPGGTVYAAAAMAMLAVWIRDSSRRAPHHA